jgi:hypothetical protein
MPTDQCVELACRYGRNGALRLPNLLLMFGLPIGRVSVSVPKFSARIRAAAIQKGHCMSIDLPEPRVVPTPAAPPVSGRLLAVFIVLGVVGIFAGLAKAPVQVASGSVDAPISDAQAAP